MTFLYTTQATPRGTRWGVRPWTTKAGSDLFAVFEVRDGREQWIACERTEALAKRRADELLVLSRAMGRKK